MGIDWNPTHALNDEDKGEMFISKFKVLFLGAHKSHWTLKRQGLESWSLNSYHAWRKLRSLKDLL